jgi:hypothetical protein
VRSWLGGLYTLSVPDQGLGVNLQCTGGGTVTDAFCRSGARAAGADLEVSQTRTIAEGGSLRHS